jgi:PAS domain S-box-containing protein
LGFGWLKATHPDDLAAAKATFLAANERLEAFQLEYRLRRQDGQYRTCIDAAKPWFGADGIFKGYIGSVIDIDDRKQAEAALRDREAQLVAETSALVRLNEASSRLWRKLGLSEGLNEILVATIELLGADMGNIQLLDTDRGILQIAAHQGFQPDFLDFFREVSTEDDSACGRTLRAGKRTIIEDIEVDAPYAPLRPIARAAGYRAVQSTPLMGRDGTVLGMLSTHWRSPHRPSEQDLRRLDLYVRQAVDFIESIRVEAALSQSSAILQTINQATPTLIYIKDRQGRLQMGNPAMMRAIGKPESEVIGRTDAEFYLNPDEAAIVMDNDRRVMETGQMQILEETVLLPEGRRTFLSSKTPYLDEAGNVIGIVGVSLDITDLKQAEAALRDREQRLTLATEAALLGVFEWRVPEDVAIWENEWMYEIFGRPRTEGTLSRQAFFENYIHPDDAETFAVHLSEAMQTGTLRQATCRIRRRDGTTIWIEFNGQFEFSNDGSPLRLVGVIADIDDRKQAEAERELLLRREQAARAEAEQANRIKDEFLAVLSHELRSPLNPILGWARLLQNGKFDEARRTEALKTIERNAKLQSQLIEDLHDTSRIMQGKLLLTVAPVSLTSVISAAAETVRLAAEAKQIQVTLDLDRAVSSISGDAARLQQVVWNLLTNAVKFTPSGGQVIVELRQLNQMAQIRVIDTGKGINPQFVPYVFEYFRQEDGSTTRKFGGLGLGLAIVRRIVEMHGGTIQADSLGEGLGATFTVNWRCCMKRGCGG